MDQENKSITIEEMSKVNLCVGRIERGVPKITILSVKTLF